MQPTTFNTLESKGLSFAKQICGTWQSSDISERNGKEINLAEICSYKSLPQVYLLVEPEVKKKKQSWNPGNF